MILRDLRHAWRSLSMRHNRVFTLSTVLSFALGIGAASAIFSIVHLMLLAPLPYQDAHQVVRLTERNPSLGLPEFAVSTPNFQSWQQHATTFAALAAIDGDNINLGVEGRFERVRALRASATIWRVLGMPLLAGREFSEAEDTLGGEAVVILGEGLWRNRFNADPALIGRSIPIDGESRRVVGIAPQDVGFATDIGVWLPLTPDPETYGRGDRRLDVLGRLREGVSPTQAQAQLATISTALAQEFPRENAGWEGAVQPVRTWIVGEDVRARLVLLLAAVLVLLLVACTNVANLHIARATAREREMGVRQALGAPRRRVLTQMISENVLLAALGGALGVMISLVALQVAVAVLPASTPRLAMFALDWRAALLAIAAAAATAITFGLVPALMAARRPLAQVLQQQGRSSVDAKRGPLRQILVVVQFTLATVLVTSAALLAQHLDRLQDNALGFRPQHLLVARITLPQASENIDLTPHLQVYARLLEEIGALPGVRSVGITSEIPLGDFNTSMSIAAGAGAALNYEQDSTQASWRVVSPGYLATLGVPLLKGRGFAADNEAPRSMLLSEGLARTLWPDGSDPVGRTVRLGNGQSRTVVGVVGDVRQTGLGDAPTPTMYMPTTWIVTETMTLLLRSDGDPLPLVAPLRAVTERIAPQYPLFDVRTMDSVLSASIAEPRMQTLVLIGFAGSSLLLAAFGVAGVMAYAVARRAPELAVRMALGASPRRLVLQVMRSGGALCAIGVALGSLLLLGTSNLWRAEAVDANVPAMLALGTAMLMVVGLVACWLPARRAARIDPSLALRDE
ncbi:MAG: ABC transporter permease [Pseudomarimonas sp.]